MQRFSVLTLGVSTRDAGYKAKTCFLATCAALIVTMYSTYLHSWAKQILPVTILLCTVFLVKFGLLRQIFFRILASQTSFNTLSHDRVVDCRNVDKFVGSPALHICSMCVYVYVCQPYVVM